MSTTYLFPFYVLVDASHNEVEAYYYWLLLPLAAVIASAGVVSDSTATVIGATIVAPLMTF